MGQLARPMAVVALIVAIFRLELLIKVTEKEYTPTIGFITTISNDTLKFGDLAFDLGITGFIACGIVVVRVPKHFFDFDSVAIRVD